MRKVVTMILPPNGEQYGFPKILDEQWWDNYEFIHDWLIANGYSENEFKTDGKIVCQQWYEVIGEENA